MQAFNECKIYNDYLSVINDYLLSDKSKIYEDNANGLSFLYMIDDQNDQNKIIKIFKLLDTGLSYNGCKNNEMYKKINYLLSTGVIFHDYKNYIEDLNVSELYILIFGKYSRVDKKGKLLLPILSNKRLLETILNRYDEDLKSKERNLFGVSDFFFMIEEHFNQDPFDTNDSKKVNDFIDEMINKLNKNLLHDGVKNMIEYWESDEIEKLKRSVF